MKVWGCSSPGNMPNAVGAFHAIQLNYCLCSYSSVAVESYAYSFAHIWYENVRLFRCRTHTSLLNRGRLPLFFPTKSNRTGLCACVRMLVRPLGYCNKQANLILPASALPYFPCAKWLRLFRMRASRRTGIFIKNRELVCVADEALRILFVSKFSALYFCCVPSDAGANCSHFAIFIINTEPE